MRITTSILSTSLLALAATSLSGCFLFEPDGDLVGTYVSGHLGNYWDCPEEAYTPGRQSNDSNRGDALAGAARPALVTNSDCDEADSARAPAEPDADADVPGNYCGGGGLDNCEGAQVTIQLSNGQGLARGIRVEEVLLLNADGDIVANLPVLDTHVASSNQPFDGELAPRESLGLRIDFRGPADAYELLKGARGHSDEGRLLIVIDSDTDGSIEITTGAVYSQPGVVT